MDDFEDNPFRFGSREIALAAVGVTALAAGVLFWAIRRSSGGVTTYRRSPGPGRTAVIGDSIVANQNGFVQYLDENVPGRSFANFGVVGQGTARIWSDLRNQVIDRGFDEVIVEGGMNDIGRDNAVDYIIGNLRSMVREAKAYGLHVVLMTLTPYHEAVSRIAQVNRVIKRDGRIWGADAVVDTHAPLADANGGLRSELVGDRMGIHPTVAGQRIIGQTIMRTAYR